MAKGIKVVIEGASLYFEAKLVEVEDSPNFAGIVAEGVRYLGLVLYTCIYE